MFNKSDPVSLKSTLPKSLVNAFPLILTNPLFRTIYEKLSATLGEDEAVIYKQRMSDIAPSLRFCAYNSGDDCAKQDLLNMRAGGGLGVEELINQTREEQAATLQEVTVKRRRKHSSGFLSRIEFSSKAN